METFAKSDSLGILRLDVCSAYEKQDCLVELLKMSVESFCKDFRVTEIASKAIPEATERITALQACGFVPTKRKVNGPHSDYYARSMEKERCA